VPTLLILGLLFPLLSWITFALSLYEQKVNKRHASPVYIPFIGPLMLDALFLMEGKPLWWLPLPWVLDIGTIMFLRAMPGMLREFWQTSAANRLALYEAREGIRCATLSLFRKGVYVLELRWERPKGEAGITGAGEPGTYAETPEGFELTAHTGMKRRLLRQGDALAVAAEDTGMHERYVLKGMEFRKLARRQRSPS
jgi:hypothetical protein